MDPTAAGESRREFSLSRRHYGGDGAEQSQAVQMSVYVVRAFVKLREVLASNATLARRLETLERSVAALDMDTRKQFDQVYEAILGLMGSGPRKN